MPKTPDKKAAIKKRTKLAEPVDVEPLDLAEQAPAVGTKAYRHWQYAQAFARGISKASGHPTTPRLITDPQGVMIQLLVTHCRDEHGKQCNGNAVLEWLENVACDFRTYASEREYGFGNHAWSAYAFARWLDNGRPKANAAPMSTTAPAKRAHIAVRKA